MIQHPIGRQAKSTAIGADQNDRLNYCNHGKVSLSFREDPGKPLIRSELLIDDMVHDGQWSAHSSETLLL